MTTRPTVIVIGAGPAGIAAALRLREEAALRVCLVAPDGMAEYLPGTLAIATGDAPASRYRTSIELGLVEVIPARAEALRPGAVKVDGSWLDAQAIIAAPGLALALDAVGRGDRIVGFWSPSGAEAAAPRVQAVERGVVQIVISSLPYRCPPAPYGLAMRLAHRARRLGQPVKVRLVTPETHPLVALGRDAGEFLLDACSQGGVEVRLGVHLDPVALRDGRVDDPAGALADASLTIVIPPHRASPLLAGLSGDEPLVAVDDRFTTAASGIFVAGDAAATAYPRAADPAAASGVVAAEAVLTSLGYRDAGPLQTPEPDCFVDHGDGRYGRIRISYPDGPPPAGQPTVGVDAPARELGGAFEDAHRRWQTLRMDAPAP